MATKHLSSEFLNFLAHNGNLEDRSERLPSLTSLSTELGVSVSRLREQLEVARALGFVEVRPRTGIRRLPYAFRPAVKASLSYAIAIDREYFESFSDLRRHLESAYWHEAVSRLKPEDREELLALLEQAWSKLRGNPIEIPHSEHRTFHLTIYKRLGNTFVLGLLAAYWDAYEAVGLNVYADYAYLQQVWSYHEQMVKAICTNDFDAGYKALIDHTDLIYHRLVPDQATNGSMVHGQIKSGEM